MKLLLTLFFLYLSQSVLAFKFSPMSQSLELASDKSSVYFLENDSSEPIAVQMSLAKRVMDLTGLETNPEEGDLLSIYPDQLIVPPGEKRSVKVSWIGKEIPNSELAFRVIAEQLPIEMAKKKSKNANIKVLLRYVAAFYVNPKDTDSKVEIEKVEVLNDKVNFTVSNKGNKHQVLTKLNLSFKNNDKNIEVESEDLKGMNGENILANSKRLFVLPKKGKLEQIKSDQKIVINFQKE